MIDLYSVSPAVCPPQRLTEPRAHCRLSLLDAFSLVGAQMGLELYRYLGDIERERVKEGECKGEKVRKVSER